jgi:hypothetical protein
MIFLAITPTGLAAALRLAKPSDAVWCGADAITEEAYAALPTPHPSRFIYALTGSDARERIEDAVSTIEEHHPGQSVWVEAVHMTFQIE